MRTNLLNLFVLITIVIGFSQNAYPCTEPPRDRFVVVLDAGHGGKDTGNIGNGYREKDIALSIVLKVGAELEKQEGVEVVYTRDSDVFIPLEKRGEIANNANADLFVSVHCNAHSSQAYGTETFVLGLHRNETNFEVAKRENSVIYLEENYEVTYSDFDINSPESFIGLTIMQESYLDQSIILADLVQKKFTNNLKRKNRGVKQAGFIVLHQTYMPSVLIETGFLTNDHEGAFLNSTNGRSKIAGAITSAIMDYSESINLNTLSNISEHHPEGNAGIEQRKDPVYDGVTFKVQLAAGSSKLDTKPYNFKGLENVMREKEGKLFKYYLGDTSNYMKIQELHQRAQKQGYPSSYIVAFKDGRKITVNEALKSKLK
ncbi:N-acetylmuramoyl-L-alanine amidase family protein [Salegentibacter chungangensis]|uniref:N-acetylmuramoyl-L-alanine amidase n=1 Tax=Salegentibacter chungangensis TaxID=1335724 RepID=A0ABW3NSK2_9FLAO